MYLIWREAVMGRPVRAGLGGFVLAVDIWLKMNRDYKGHIRRVKSME